MTGVKGQKSGGRNRKTTAELKASGGLRACRHKDRADSSIEPKGSPRRPPRLNAKQKRVWDAVIEVMPEAALGSADTAMMTEMVRWFGVYLDQMKCVETNPLDSKALASAVKSWQEFRKVAIDYGLTPQSRAAIKLPSSGQAEESAFASIVSRMGGSLN